MDRRNFLAAAGAAAALGAAGAAHAEQGGGANQFLEWRKFITMPDKKVLETFLAEAAIPAWNRQGMAAIGAFTVKYGLNSPPAIWVLIPHASLEAMATCKQRMMADAEFMKAAEPFMNSDPASPAFYRVESSVMRAFDAWPQVVAPPQAKEQKNRIFELRIYESHSPANGKKKVKMFNSGESEIFKKAGANPVFFAETILGPNMPSLQYMLCHDDFAARDAAWKNFGGSPEWKALRSNPEFTPDPVSNISDVILAPTKYSQI